LAVMSQAQAEAFLDRVESDEDFARELESLREDRPAVLERVHGAGFDATPDEIREAFLDRYGAELTQEQLDQIAAGTDPAVIAGTVVGVVAWVAAASAAVF
jgi:predicted ribosomally synthesized peptide with nif11-like leader